VSRRAYIKQRQVLPAGHGLKPSALLAVPPPAAQPEWARELITKAAEEKRAKRRAKHALQQNRDLQRMDRGGGDIPAPVVPDPEGL
jgi:hypothetical protein